VKWWGYIRGALRGCRGWPGVRLGVGKGGGRKKEGFCGGFLVEKGG